VTLGTEQTEKAHEAHERTRAHTSAHKAEMRPTATQTLAGEAAQPPEVRGVSNKASLTVCTPISSKLLGKVTSDWSQKLGEGATGEVYRGTLDSQPIAVKRLRLPPDASPQVVHMLQKRFRAELGTLSSFSHPRIVRLLHFCEDAASAAHPFSLVFELLEEGSLADWLRGEKGEPSRMGVLTALERVDAALGVAHGLAYLHGIDSGGEAGTGAGEPTVHRDVKSANVGFTRIGGDLYAKVLECVAPARWPLARAAPLGALPTACHTPLFSLFPLPPPTSLLTHTRARARCCANSCGLAKAIRGGAAAAAAGAGGASFSSGVLGTPGYMAPELAEGVYSMASEVYSVGVVLLELLQGQRVSQRTAGKLREAIEDDGVSAVEALAEGACWPAPTHPLLARLIADCIHAREAKRPQSLAPVISRLKQVRAMVAPLAAAAAAAAAAALPGSAAGGGGGGGGGGSAESSSSSGAAAAAAAAAASLRMAFCGVCMEEVEERKGLRCKVTAAQLAAAATAAAAAAAGAGPGAAAELLPVAQAPEPHFVCKGCFQGHVKAYATVERLCSNKGAIPCTSRDCAAAPWALEDLSEHLDTPTAIAFACGLRYYAIDVQRMMAERAAGRVAEEEEIRRIGDRAERVRRLRLRVVEDDFTLQCPRCSGAFLDFSGCAALYCKDDAGPPSRVGCGISFCALCLKDCSGDAHKHVKEEHARAELRDDGNPAMYFFHKEDYNAAHGELRTNKLVARLRTLASDPELQRALLDELEKADLADVGVDARRVEVEVGMTPKRPARGGAGGGAAGQGGAQDAWAAELGDGSWSCENCTLRNKRSDLACAACAKKLELPSADMTPARLMKLLRGGVHHPRVVAEGARALLALTYRGEKECAGCLAAGALGVLLAGLREHMVEEDLAVQACGALANMAFYPQHRRAVAASGAVPLLVEAWTRHAAAKKYAGIALDELGFGTDGVRHEGPETCVGTGGSLWLGRANTQPLVCFLPLFPPRLTHPLTLPPFPPLSLPPTTRPHHQSPLGHAPP
jgi:hypothetical protein